MVHKNCCDHQRILNFCKTIELLSVALDPWPSEDFGILIGARAHHRAQDHNAAVRQAAGMIRALPPSGEATAVSMLTATHQCRVSCFWGSSDKIFIPPLVPCVERHCSSCSKFFLGHWSFS